MSKKESSQDIISNGSNVRLPEIKSRVRSSERKRKDSQEKQALKLPIINKKNNPIIEDNANYPPRDKKHHKKSEFLKQIQNKMNKVLNKFKDKFHHQNNLYNDTNDFDLQVNRRNKQLNKNIAFRQQIKRAENIGTDSPNYSPQLLKPNLDVFACQDRPKSSRGTSNDKNLIELKNQGIKKRRPKSSIKPIKDINSQPIQGLNIEQQNQLKQQRRKQNKEFKQKILKDLQQPFMLNNALSNNRNKQKDLRKMDKQDFANQIKNNMNNILQCIDQFIPKGYVNQHLNIESQEKIRNQQQQRQKDLVINIREIKNQSQGQQQNENKQIKQSQQANQPSIQYGLDLQSKNYAQPSEQIEQNYNPNHKLDQLQERQSQLISAWIQQKDLRAVDKNQFANQIQNNMLNVLNCIQKFLPTQKKIQSQSKLKQQNIQMKKKQQKQNKPDQVSQENKKSTDLSKNMENLQKHSGLIGQLSKPAKEGQDQELIYRRRPKSSKSAKFNSKQKQLKQKNKDQLQNQAGGQKIKQQKKQQHQNLISNSMLMENTQNSYQTQKVIGNNSQIQKKLSPKIPKAPKKVLNPSKQTTESKRQVVFNIKKSNRPLSEKKILSIQHQNKSSFVNRNGNQNSVEKRNKNSQSKKQEEPKDTITNLISGNKKILMGDNLTTQQLKQAKKQLDQKVKQIERQMKLLNSKQDLSLVDNDQSGKIRMRISGRDWKKVNKEGQGLEEGDNSLDNGLDRIQKLQNRGEHMFGAYLQNRMMLMDLNIYNKQQQVLESVYIGDNQKNNQ